MTRRQLTPLELLMLMLMGLHHDLFVSCHCVVPACRLFRCRLTIDESLDSALAHCDPRCRGCSMPEPLNKSAVREASARDISVEALLRVKQFCFLTILKYAVTIHLPTHVPGLVTDTATSLAFCISR